MIRSVIANEIQIGADVYRHTIAITSDEVIDDWPDIDVADLQDSDFAALLASKPEVIVVGTGAAIQFPPRDLVFAMARRGVGFEVMDTAAAARTFNVLASEDRQVAAVLYVS